MKMYIGTKVIKAEPMTMKEAQKVLGRKIATLKPVTVEENGYLVEYKDGYKSGRQRTCLRKPIVK